MKVRIGRSRSRADAKRSARSPLEIALGPAFAEGEWDVPGRFNFTRDVVDVLARDTKRRALMHLGHDGIIEPRTFHQIAESTARWAALLRERGVSAEDRLVVVANSSPEWVEIILAGIKVGAVTIPCSESITAAELDARVSSADARLIVAARGAEGVVAALESPPDVVYLDERGGRSNDPVPDAPAENTSSRDAAFILSTAGTAAAPMGVVHSHGATFAARVQAEHWLDAGPGDAVWCTADSGNALAVWAVLGSWSRGAEVILHTGSFDADERLDLIDRLGTTILCQTPAEYAALTGLRAFRRYRPQRLRRLVSTGDTLARDVIATYEDAWGMTIHEGYGQTETAVVVANGIDTGFRSGSVGLPIVGHEVAVIDDQGNVVGPEVEGELAVRGRPPSLFMHYWGAPDETKAAFRGDWFATGDIASTDEDGFIRLAGRADDMITSRGRRFGPFEIEHALSAHPAVTESGAVGIRDLERGGQFVRAFVVLRTGVAASEQLEAELRGFVESSLPEYAVPREIEFLDELPRTSSGNIRRAALRERQVSGRPLWETTPVTEPEPLLPSPEPASPAEPAGFVVQEYFPYTQPEAASPQEPSWLLAPEPVAYVEPATEPPVAIDPPASVEPAPEPVASEPTPEPVAYAEPATESTVPVEPEAEPVAHVEPAATVDPEPEPVAYVEPEDAIDSTVAAAPPVPQPEPTAIESPPSPPPAAPAPAAATEPTAFEEPAAFQKPLAEEPVAVEGPMAPGEASAPSGTEPLALVEPETPTAEPELAPPVDSEMVAAPGTSEPTPAADRERETEAEPESPTQLASSEPHASAQHVEPATPEQVAFVEPDPERVAVQPEPVAVESEPVAVEPEPVHEPPVDASPATFDPAATADEQEEPLGPLPDYVVDPNAEPRVRPVETTPVPDTPEPTGLGLQPVELESDSDKPDLAGLGLRPVNFDLDRTDTEPERAPAPTRPRPDAAPPADDKKGRGKSRSTGEVGDELEDVDWMGGLSTRLSAYSLSQDDEAPETADEHGDDSDDDAD